MENSKIANEILRQLGGNKFIVMTGATYYFENKTLVVKFKGSNISNIMKVTLNENDEYSVEFIKYKKFNLNTVAKIENINADMLIFYFEENTGLITSI